MSDGSWLLDIPAQVAYRDGVEVTPTVRTWDFEGFDVEYDATTQRMTIRGPGSTDWKDSVRLATAAALPANTRTANVLEADANGALPTIDGVAPVVGDRVLLKDETPGANNGLWVVDDLGSGSTPWSMSRAQLSNESAEVTNGLAVYVGEGTANAEKVFTLTTNDPITLNSTSLTFDTVIGGGIDQFPLATLPTASANDGATVTVTDSLIGPVHAISDGTSWVEQRRGTEIAAPAASLQFNGSNNAIFFPATPEQTGDAILSPTRKENDGTGFCVAYRVKVDAAATLSGFVFSNQDASPNFRGIGITWETDKPKLLLRSTTTLRIDKYSDTTVNDGSWHLIIINVDPGGANVVAADVDFYVDTDTPTSATTSSDNLGANSTLSGGVPCIGGRLENAGSTIDSFLSGSGANDILLRDVQFWGRPLTSAEITRVVNGEAVALDARVLYMPLEGSSPQEFVNFGTAGGAGWGRGFTSASFIADVP